jgi:biopolymer transport protein ExbD
MTKLLQLTVLIVGLVVVAVSCSSEKQGRPVDLPTSSTEALDDTEATTSSVTSIAGSDPSIASTTTVLSLGASTTAVEQLSTTTEKEVVATSTTILMMDSTTTIPRVQVPSFETVEPGGNFSMSTVEPNA